MGNKEQETEKKKKRIELTTSVLQNRIIVDKIWSNYQYTDSQMSSLTGIGRCTILRYSRGERDYKLSDFICIMQQLGYRVILETEGDRIDYDGVDGATSKRTNKRYTYRCEPTREDVFKLLRKWYGDFNQTLMAKALGTHQAAISKALRDNHKD